MLPPRLILLGIIHTADLPAGSADRAIGGKAKSRQVLAATAREESEPVLGVGFPYPVACNLRDVSEALLAVAQLSLDLLPLVDIDLKTLIDRGGSGPVPPRNQDDQADKKADRHAAEQDQGRLILTDAGAERGQHDEAKNPGMIGDGDRVVHNGGAVDMRALTEGAASIEQRLLLRDQPVIDLQPDRVGRAREGGLDQVLHPECRVDIAPERRAARLNSVGWGVSSIERQIE